MRRISIKSMMWYVGFIALGLAALRNADDAWVCVMILVTFGVLAISIPGVACQQGRERLWWLGFGIFGFGYVFLVFCPWFPEVNANMPTAQLLNYIHRDSIALTKVERAYIANAYNPAASPLYDGPAATSVPLRREQRKLREQLTSMGSPLVAPKTVIFSLTPSNLYHEPFARVAHCLFALLAGQIGAFVSSRMYREPQDAPGVQ